MDWEKVKQICHEGIRRYVHSESCCGNCFTDRLVDALKCANEREPELLEFIFRESARELPPRPRGRPWTMTERQERKAIERFVQLRDEGRSDEEACRIVRRELSVQFDARTMDRRIRDWRNGGAT
jgi:uncharacterized protein YoaH (UPF0181 family)